MDGQMNLEDFLPMEKPSMHEPAVYSENGRQYLKIQKIGEKLEISIFTDNEAMIIRLDAEEFEKYLRGI